MPNNISTGTLLQTILTIIARVDSKKIVYIQARTLVLVVSEIVKPYPDSLHFHYRQCLTPGNLVHIEEATLRDTYLFAVVEKLK